MSENDLQTIKKRIWDEGLIEEILTYLGCEFVNKESGGKRIVAALPPEFNRRNKRAVQVYNDENLNSAIRNIGIKGDIYAIVGYILFECTDFEQVKTRLFDIKKWICENLNWQEYLGYKPSEQTIRKQDWNGWLHKIKKKRRRETVIRENPIIPESVLDNYYMSPVQWWIDEGISYDTQLEFGIGFDLESQRIVIPVHNADGKLLGIKGRYIGKNQKILDQIKYIYLHPFGKSCILYNIHRALPYILQNKEVIILESEKSTMLAWEHGYKNCVAIAGDSITDAQIKILKDIGIDIRWVFAFDVDKDKEWIKQQVNEQRIIGRSLYALYDTKRLFQEKDSPFDRGKETFEQLYNECCYRLNREE